MPSTSKNKNIKKQLQKELFAEPFCTFVQLTLKKIILLMKKTYVSPLTEEVNIEIGNTMLGTSDTTVDSEEQLSNDNDRRGEWGNLWN